MKRFLVGLRARLRTHGGTSATSRLGCALLAALVLVLVGVVIWIGGR